MARVTDDLRRRLLETAAAVLADEGPAALTARRLTREVGASTMAVYTHFGSMPGLVRAVVADGFDRLHARLDQVPRTDDTLHDLVALAAAYQAHAREHPSLYAVMFGSASLGGLRLSEDEKAVGLAAFGQIVAAVARAMDAGALRADDPAAVAGQLWTALHGYLMLEQAGFHRVVDDPERHLLQPMLFHLVAGLLPDS